MATKTYNTTKDLSVRNRRVMSRKQRYIYYTVCEPTEEVESILIYSKHRSKDMKEALTFQNTSFNWSGHGEILNTLQVVSAFRRSDLKPMNGMLNNEPIDHK